MFKMKLADIGEGLESGKILEFFVKVGDTIEEGDDVFNVETEKVTTEISSPVDGTIKEIHVNAGDEVMVGALVLTIDDGSGAGDEDEDEGAEEDAGGGSASVIGEVPMSDDELPARHAPAAPEPEVFVNTQVLATPLVRKMAADQKIDLTHVKGSGPNGKILKKDLEAHATAAPVQPTAAQAAPQPQAYVAPQAYIPPQPQPQVVVPTPPPPPQAPPVVRRPMFFDNPGVDLPDTIEAFSGIRKAISRAMTISRSKIPETTLFKDIDVTKLWELRGQLKNDALAQGIKLTFLAFFVKAVAIALHQFPNLNARLDEEKSQIIQKRNYNMGIAVDTPAGLMVPVIKHADQKSVLRIAAEINDLAVNARNRTIKPTQLTGGTFTLTNFGSAGIEFATPVINYPEVGILGVGAIKRAPVIRDNSVVPGYLLPVSLAIDHRVIDGADGGRFLKVFSDLLTNPFSLLM